MKTEWDGALERWQAAGVIDAAAAERIRSFEQQRGGPGLRWPVLIALIFGGLMLGAGVLLFVAAHWDELSPAARFTLVLAMVAAFHGAGAVTSNRSPNLAITLHGLGTGALGAGIFLAGQIFNLRAHWPSGALLWAAGAWAGWALRSTGTLQKDWLQFSFAALLTPFWLAGEWVEIFPRFTREPGRVLGEGLLMLAIAYFTAGTRNRDDSTRTVLVWIGGVFFLPCAISLALEPEWWRNAGTGAQSGAIAGGYAVAFGLPLALAFWLRGRQAWMTLVAAAWVLLLGVIGETENPGLYLWCVAGASGMVAWGVREGRSERVNIGITGFALTLVFFYFSEVMNKLGRSASLVCLGLLFLVGGWALEKLRRQLVVRARQTA